MNHLMKITIQGISFILSQFVDSDTRFLWITTPDYSRQIYIGPAYEKIFGRPCADLYKNPEIWRQSLASTENKQITQLLKSRGSEEFRGINTAFYRIYDTAKKMHWIKDTCFHLFSFSGRQIATVGIVEDITETQWKNEIFKYNDHSYIDSFTNCGLTALFNQELQISQNELQFSEQQNNALNTFDNKSGIRIILTSSGKAVKLTQREAECLFHLSNGQSGKIIARLLRISPRTVEVHLDNIKKKLECNTRIELMSKFCAIVM